MVAATAVVTNFATDSPPVWLRWLVVGSRPWWTLLGLVSVTVVVSVVAARMAKEPPQPPDVAADLQQQSQEMSQFVTINVGHSVAHSQKASYDQGLAGSAPRESRIIPSSTGITIFGDHKMQLHNVRYSVSEHGAVEFTASHIYIEEVQTGYLQVDSTAEGNRE
jgi:hypothetical protein